MGPNSFEKNLETICERLPLFICCVALSANECEKPLLPNNVLIGLAAGEIEGNCWLCVLTGFEITFLLGQGLEFTWNEIKPWGPISKKVAISSQFLFRHLPHVSIEILKGNWSRNTVNVQNQNIWILDKTGLVRLPNYLDFEQPLKSEQNISISDVRFLTKTKPNIQFLDNFTKLDPLYS